MILMLLVAACCWSGQARAGRKQQGAANYRHPYTYKYNVADPATLNNFEAYETGDPNIVRGSYRVDLPDGRTQVVTYEVDPVLGYQADVRYEGEASYPDRPSYRTVSVGSARGATRARLGKYKRQLKKAVIARVPKNQEGAIDQELLFGKRNVRKVLVPKGQSLDTQDPPQHHQPLFLPSSQPLYLPDLGTSSSRWKVSGGGGNLGTVEEETQEEEEEPVPEPEPLTADQEAGYVAEIEFSQKQAVRKEPGLDWDDCHSLSTCFSAFRIGQDKPWPSLEQAAPVGPIWETTEFQNLAPAPLFKSQPDEELFDLVYGHSDPSQPASKSESVKYPTTTTSSSVFDLDFSDIWSEISGGHVDVQKSNVDVKKNVDSEKNNVDFKKGHVEESSLDDQTGHQFQVYHPDVWKVDGSSKADNAQEPRTHPNPYEEARPISQVVYGANNIAFKQELASFEPEKLRDAEKVVEQVEELEKAEERGETQLKREIPASLRFKGPPSQKSQYPTIQKGQHDLAPVHLPPLVSPQGFIRKPVNKPESSGNINKERKRGSSNSAVNYNSGNTDNEEEGSGDSTSKKIIQSSHISGSNRGVNKAKEEKSASFSSSKLKRKVIPMSESKINQKYTFVYNHRTKPSMESYDSTTTPSLETSTPASQESTALFVETTTSDSRHFEDRRASPSQVHSVSKLANGKSKGKWKSVKKAVRRKLRPKHESTSVALTTVSNNPKAMRHKPLDRLAQTTATTPTTTDSVLLADTTTVSELTQTEHSSNPSVLTGGESTTEIGELIDTTTGSADFDPDEEGMTILSVNREESFSESSSSMIITINGEGVTAHQLISNNLPEHRFIELHADQAEEVNHHPEDLAQETTTTGDVSTPAVETPRSTDAFMEAEPVLTETQAPLESVHPTATATDSETTVTATPAPSHHVTPVHRSGRVKLIYRGHKYVPEHSNSY